MSEKRNIAKATLIIGIFAVLGKLLGFLREIIIASLFGTTFKTDAFFVGLAGPDFVREIISGGVLSAVFIPVYSACLAGKGEDESRSLLNTIVTILLIALVLAAVLGIPLAPLIVKLVAPEIKNPSYDIAVQVTRIIFPSILFMGMASLYGSLLNVRKHFFTPSMTQLMLNVGIIGGAVLLASKYGIKSLAIGFLAGAVLQLLVLLPSLKEKAVSFRFEFKLTPEIKQMFIIWVPLFIASFVATANDLVSRSLAAGIAEGNVAGITFANRIRETIWLLCAVPLGTAVFPYLSDYAAKNETGELEKIISFSIRITAFLALPMCLVMFFYNEPIVRLLFQRGLFNDYSTAITSSALQYYAFGALFFALNYVVIRVFYSIQDTKTPLIVYSAAFIVNIGLGVILRNNMMIGGIALARSISDILVFILLIVFLVRKYPLMRFNKIFANLLKIGSIALICIGISLVVYKITPGNGYILKLIASLIVFSVSYAGMSLVFGIDEIQAAKREFLRKIA